MPGSFGLHHDTNSKINSIREILKNYKQGFPVVRELLQNADDAGATTLTIGWLPGLSGAENPILTGPALFVLNNGPFTESNDIAIRQISGSDKGGQDGSIGKFGRGLKSLFHMCEGFVYASSIQSRGGTGQWDLDQSKLLLPWAGSEHHREWDKYDSGDETRIAEAVRRFITPGGPWFCLWIPLRRQASGTPWIQPGEFPGDSNEPPKFLVDEVRGNCSETVRCLPLLKSLTSVVYAIHNAPLCEVHFGRGSTRRRFLAATTKPGEWPFRGQLLVGGAQSVYAGHELLLPLAGKFEEIKSRDSWPVRNVENDKDAGEPHAAVVFSALPSQGSGSLRVSDAVFLPVGPRPTALTCEAPWEIDLVLHSYAFVNSNRTMIELRRSGYGAAGAGLAETEHELEADWNSELRSRGVMRCLIPALAEFVDAASLPFRDAQAVTMAVRDWLDARPSDREDVIRTYQWLPCIGEDGEPVYRKLPPAQPFHELPPYSAGEIVPSSIFPALPGLAGKLDITIEGMSRLAGRAAPWPESALKAFIESVPVEGVFSSDEQLEYVAQVLGSNAEVDAHLQQPLIQKLQQALQAVGLSGLKGRPAFQRLISMVHSDLVVTFDDAQLSLAPHVTEAITRHLASSGIAVLVLPQTDMDRDPAPTRAGLNLSVADTRALLEAVSNPPESLRGLPAFRQVRARLASAAFRSHGETGRVAVQEFGDMPLLRAWVANRGDTDVSYREIRRAEEENLLLRGPGIAQPDPAPALAAAAGLDGGLFVVPDYVQVTDVAAEPCTLAACAAILLRTRELAPAAARVEFLQKLLKATPWDRSTTLAVRYLLHGHAEAATAETDEPLLFGGTSGDVWSKLAHQALGDAGWRFVDRDLVDHIPAAHHAAFGVENIDAAAVAALILERGPASLDCGDSVLTDADRERILEEVDDRELLRALPMHRAIDGDFVTISERTYIKGSYGIQPELKSAVQLLRPISAAMQEKLAVRPWDPEAAINTALNDESPGKLAGVILSAVALAAGSLNATTTVKLRETAWLPLAREGFVKPGDVVQIEGMEDDIARFAEKCGGAWVGIKSIAGEPREHQGFARLLNGVIQSGNEALTTLPLMIEEAALSTLFVGSIELSPMRLRAFVTAFSDAPDGVADAGSLFAAALKVFSPEEVATQLGAPLCKAISPDRFVAILNHLSKRHDAAGANVKTELRDLFDHYLEAAHRDGFGTSALRSVRLLNQDRKPAWKSTKDLCHDHPNVDPAQLVNRRQAEILGLAAQGVPVSTSAANGPAEAVVNELAAPILREYFAAWRGRCPDEAIGGFLAFLGDEPGLRDLAQEYLGMRDIETVRAMVEWVPLRGVGGGGEDAEEVLAKQRFVVERVPPGKPQRVTNLVGDIIQVRTATTLASLIQNRLFNSPIHGKPRTNLLQLFDVDPAAYDSEALSALLRASTFAILGEVYWQEAFRTGDPGGLNRFWQDLEQSHLVDLQTAQKVVLHHLLSSAKLLKIGSAHALQKLVRMEAAGIRGEIEAEKLADQSKRDNALKEAGQKRSIARAELEKLLDARDPETIAALLTAVRHRIEDESQYTSRSVVFELFQNADDAAVERDELHGATGGRDRYKFYMASEGSRLSFGHRGRGINEFRPANGNADQFKDRDFHRDLEKMLLLGASDKGLSNQDQVTGKFGLGFKSVFLLSSAPRLVSGPLAVKIVGAMYPLAITGQGYSEATARLEEIELRDGTLLELPVEPNRSDRAMEAVRAFSQQAPVLAAFARRTHHIILREGASEQHLVWAPREVQGVSSCFVGALPGAAARGLPERALFLDVPNEGGLLLGLDALGVAKLPKETPGIWVTTPTEEAMGAGIALNGRRFELHAGRAELAIAASTANGERARALGMELGRLLASLVSAAEADWPGLRDRLALSDDAEPYGFWESMLRVLRNVCKPGPGFQLLHATLWQDSHCGAARLFGSSRVLPSGLGGEHRRLLLAREVRYRVTGLLASEAILGAVMDLPAVRGEVPPGSAIAQSVVDTIPTAGLVGGEALDLARALQWEFMRLDYVAEPKLASLLGGLLTADDLDEEHTTKSERDDAVHPRDLLDKLRFVAADGSLHPPRELVAGSPQASGVVDPDEVKRAAFAPECKTLSANYDEAGVRFFVLCRIRMEADSDTLLEWGQKSEGAKFDRFLQYTQTGTLRAEVQEAVRKGSPAWLADKGAEQRLQSYIAPGDHFAPASLGLLPPPSPLLLAGHSGWRRPEPPSPAQVAKGLAELPPWWETVKAARLQAYDRSVYGDTGQLLAGRTTEELEDTRDQSVRERWMRLFVLGAAHTLGRQRPEQHRDFLAKFERDGWLNLFATRHTQWDGRELLKSLQDRVDGLVDDESYARWMTLFMPLFQVSYRLDEYIELFTVANRDLGSGMSLSQFLDPAHNSAFSGGGLNAPGTRTGLGIGAQFVLREMARAGLLTADDARQHCIVPRERVRDLLAWLGRDVSREARGEQSRLMAKFLREHLDERYWDFDGAFDIALYEFARESELQRQWFGEELVPYGGSS